MTPDYRFRIRVLGWLALGLVLVALALLGGAAWGRALDSIWL